MIRTSKRTRELVKQSLPQVRQRRNELLHRIERYVAGDQKDRQAAVQAQSAAMALLALLIDQAETFVRTGRSGTLADLAEEHEASGIGSEHYSRFGDSLVPIISDVLGHSVPPGSPQAWCELFWQILEARDASADLEAA